MFAEVNQIRKMGNGLLDLPMQLLMSSSIDNVKEIAFKTISSVSKVFYQKLKRFSLYNSVWCSSQFLPLVSSNTGNRLISRRVWNQLTVLKLKRYGHSICRGRRKEEMVDWLLNLITRRPISLWRIQYQLLLTLFLKEMNNKVLNT